MTKKHFEKLSPDKKRGAVAKDVIKHLNGFRATSGTYLSGSVKNGNIPSDKLADSLKKSRDCHVCGIGAAFLSYVSIVNSYGFFTKYQYTSQICNVSTCDVHMRDKLGEIFDRDTLYNIENAFEQQVMHYDKDHGMSLAAVEFGKRYKTDRGRLKAIMQNIIDNNGEFIP